MEKQEKSAVKFSSVKKENKIILSAIAKNLSNKKLFVDKIELAKKTFKNLKSLHI